MKISKNCDECIGTVICGTSYADGECLSFHKALEKKFTKLCRSCKKVHLCIRSDDITEKCELYDSFKDREK